MRFLIILGLGGLLLGGGVSPAWAAPHELTNEELDGVTAGGLSTNILDGLLHFQFGGTAGGLSIDGSGTITLAGGSLPGNVGAIYIREQNNNHSIVNVAAVNSQVAVGVNMNVNINSAHVNVNQINLAELNRLFVVPALVGF
jgi:hypothetical protein